MRIDLEFFVPLDDGPAYVRFMLGRHELGRYYIYPSPDAGLTDLIGRVCRGEVVCWA